jgi:hypothetical protein
MSINFPSTGLTANVSTYTLNGRTWLWNGYSWQLQTQVAGYTGSLGYTGSKGAVQIYFQNTTPASPNVGDIWINTDDAIEFVYINDGDSSQWVEFANQGFVGYTGSKGDQGPAGGYTGSQGNIGYTGSLGYTGSASTVVGYTGSQGDQGNLGYTGSKGDIGYTGSKGDQGVIGYTGSQGVQGYTGSQGNKGDLGYTGSKGTDGIIGVDGYTGSKGDIGYTGSKGDIGYTGSKGDTGYAGSKGNQGDTGLSNSIFKYKAKTSTQSGATYVGDTYIVWNNVTQTSATTIYISHRTSDSLDIDIFLSTLKQTESIVIQDQNTSNNYQTWTINGTVTNTTNGTDSWYTVPVTYAGGGGSNSFSGDQAIALAIVAGVQGYTGSQGPIGYTGSASTVIGYTGSQGPIGYTGSSATITDLANSNATTYYPVMASATTGSFTVADTNSGRLTYTPTTGLSTYGLSVTGTVSLTTASNDGTINGVSIGSTTANTGTFTSLTANGTTNTAAIITPTTANSSTAWTTGGINLKIQARTYTDTSSTAGTVASSYINALAAPTFASTNAITITNATNLFVDVPSAGTNSTLTNAWAIYAGGRIRATDFTGTIGATTASAGSFTTLGATGVFTASAGTSSLPSIVTSSGSTTGLYSSTANVLGVSISATSIGTFTSTGLNNMAIGATTASTGAFTTLSATGTITATTAGQNISLGSNSGAGVTTIDSGSTGSINDMSIGATSASTGAFTSLTANGTTNTAAIITPTTALSSTAWTTAGINTKIQARTYTDTSSTTGTVASSYINALAAPTFASTNTITITDAANLFVAAPAAGTGSTLTNAWAIYAGGRIRATDFTGTIGATTSSTGAFTTLSASSTVSGTGFSTYLASPPAIGGTAAAAGTFTQLTVNGSNLNTTISPTGTGTVTIAPAGILTMGTAGVTHTMAGNISAITSNQTVTLSPTGTGTVAISPVGALTINPTASSTMNNVVIGGTTAAAGTFTTVTDSIGNVRTIVQNAQSGAGSYTLLSTDAGKHIYVTGAGGVTCPVSVFSAGQAITIVNNTSSSITITAPSAGTQYLSGTASTGNRTLAQRGVATLLYVVGGATPTVMASGAGLT